MIELSKSLLLLHSLALRDHPRNLDDEQQTSKGKWRCYPNTVLGALSILHQIWIPWII